MADLSAMSTEDLLRAYQSTGTAAAPTRDLSAMSTEDLLRAYQATGQGGQMQGPPDERPLLQRIGSKVGSFLQNVYENPPPSAATIRDIVKGAPQAAQELTWGADPQAAEPAAGTMFGAAGLAVTGPRALQFPVRQPAAAPAAAPSAVAPVLAAAARQDVAIPRYLATEGNTAPMVAAGLKNVPFASGPIEQSATSMLEQMG